MTQPNPFLMANSLEHLVNPKLVSGLSGTDAIYNIGVDIVNVDTYYGRQLGGPTGSQQFQQAYIQYLGSTGLPVEQAFINSIGTSGTSGSAFFNNIGSTTSAGQAFFKQIGTSGSSGIGYFNTIFCNNFIPPISGGGGSGTTFIAGSGIVLSGSSLGTTITSSIQGGSGINVNTPLAGQPYQINSSLAFTGISGISVTNSGGNTYSIRSLVNVIGGNFISVTPTGSTFRIDFTGTTGPTASNLISGTPGQYSFFDSSGVGLTSSSVLTTQNTVGQQGQIVFYTPQGITSSQLLSYNTELLSPTIVINDPLKYSNNGSNYLRLTSDDQSSYIQAGSKPIQNSSSPLNITGYLGGPRLAQFDIPNGKVTINPSGNTVNPDYPQDVQVIGNGSTSGTILGVSGATYNIYIWGGGGAGSSFSGGAGGYANIKGITSGVSGITFNFNLSGGTGGGGQAVFFSYNTGSGITLAAVAPGGGAGGNLSPGVAYGEIGGGVGQGFSALQGGGTGGSYNVFSSNPTFYRLTSGIQVSGATFQNVRTDYGTSGTIVNGSTIIIQDTSLQGSGSTLSGLYTYTFGASGATLIFNSSGVSFFNSTYNISGNTFGQFNLLTIPYSVGTTGIYAGLSGITGVLSGYSSFNNGNPSILQIQNAFAGISGTSFQNVSGNQSLIGNTYYLPAGSRLQLPLGGGYTFSGGSSGSTGTSLFFSLTTGFTFSQSIGSTIVPSVFVNSVTGPTGTFVQVGDGIINYRGISGGSTFGGQVGGGGGFFGGGGGATYQSLIGGGGAGSAYISVPVGVQGITGGGSGTSPYSGQYNFNSIYGYGGTGIQGGSPYYVIERVVLGTQSTVLQVNGNENVSGVLTVGITGGNSINSFGRITGQAINTGYDTVNNYGYSSTTVSGTQGGAYFPFGLNSGPSLTSFNLTADNTGNLSMNGQLRVGASATSGAAGSINATGNVTTTAQILVGTGAPVGAAGSINAIGNVTTTAQILVGTGAASGAPGSITATGNITGLDLIATSDRRVKDNIQTVDSALDKVLNLRGVYFTRKGSEKRNLGVIAQEIEEFLPEVVFTDDSPEQMKSVAYGNIIGLLIEAIKEQQEQIEKLKQNTM
jgi:hypothetical protein